MVYETLNHDNSSMTIIYCYKIVLNVCVFPVKFACNVHVSQSRVVALSPNVKKNFYRLTIK
jgi:hypothetical protein